MMWVVLGPAEGEKGGEGQGCVYNVNTVKATDMKGRGERESGAPPGPMYPLPTNSSPGLLQAENTRYNWAQCTEKTCSAKSLEFVVVWHNWCSSNTHWFLTLTWPIHMFSNSYYKYILQFYFCTTSIQAYLKWSYTEQIQSIYACICVYVSMCPYADALIVHPCAIILCHCTLLKYISLEIIFLFIVIGVYCKHILCICYLIAYFILLLPHSENISFLFLHIKGLLL